MDMDDGSRGYDLVRVGSAMGVPEAPPPIPVMPSPSMTRADYSTGTLKTTISLGKQPTVVRSGALFYQLRPTDHIGTFTTVTCLGARR